MGLFNHFPYPDTHQLNLDWILDMLGGIQKALTDAQAAATAAENSATSAQTFANNAQTFANNAQDSATSAQDSATAQPSAQQAKAAATAAKTSATNAQTSAENAQMSVTQAHTFANSAQTSANIAQTSATSAQTSANIAQDAATSAQDSATSAQESATELAALLFNNAGAHNAIYRGKSLGNTVTTAQYAAIEAGTFDDLYIGDYWTIGGVNYRIAAFDYYLNSGDTPCTTHHVVIVPDTFLYNLAMNNTNTTDGGYVGTEMYKNGLKQAKTTIKAAFSGHVLSHRLYLTYAVANGIPSFGKWYDSEVDLMCEEMVYGCSIFCPTSDGSIVPANYRIEKSQLPLFAHEPSRICNSDYWWLRDVITNTQFSVVGGDGLARYAPASESRGVRPAFCIY